MRVLWLLLIAGTLISGCASSQARPSRVGEVGLNSAFERALSEQDKVRHTYEYKAGEEDASLSTLSPNTAAAGGGIVNERYVVGSTPTREIVIEATGKPELFRVSREGYLPQTQWVASTGGSKNIEVLFELHLDLPYGSR